MYVCMFGHFSSPCVAKTAHTYIHTYTQGYLQLVDRFVFLCMFEVCVSFRGKNRATLKSALKKPPQAFQNPYFL